MITVICTIYDARADSYLPPFFVRSEGVAVRMFEATMKNPESDFARFPEDYTLFLLGDWNDDDASFKIEPTPKAIMTGVAMAALIKKQAKENN